MALGSLPALGVQTPQINTLGNFEASRANAMQAKSTRMAQEAEGLKGLATVSLGVLRGNLEGQADPAEWEQALDMLEQGGADPQMLKELRGKPHLANVMARGSIETLKMAQDEKQFELQKQKFEADLAQAAAGPAPTDDMKELAQINKERAASGQPALGMEEFLKGKASGVSVTNVLPGEPQGGASVGQFQKDLGGIMAKDYGSIRDLAKASRANLGNLKVMEDAIADPGFYSGFGSDQVLQLKRMASALGMDPDGVDSMETFNALNKQAALQAMGGSLGTGFSNADRDFVVEQVPSLTNTPQGNKKIIEIQRKIAERNIEIAAMATEYVQKNGVLDAGFEKELAAFAEANPLFGDMTSDNGGGADEVINAEDYFLGGN